MLIPMRSASKPVNNPKAREAIPWVNESNGDDYDDEDGGDDDDGDYEIQLLESKTAGFSVPFQIFEGPPTRG